LAEDSSVENVAKQTRRAIDRYELELANHFEIEEQVLFPECGPMPIVSDLLGEHRAMEALIAELRTTPSAGLLEQFCALLSRHIRREENELFEQVQAVLPREVLDRLGCEIDRRAVRICI
jgi:hemerythrin-like domain-containing protein